MSVTAETLKQKKSVDKTWSIGTPCKDEDKEVGLGLGKAGEWINNALKWAKSKPIFGGKGDVSGSAGVTVTGDIACVSPGDVVKAGAGAIVYGGENSGGLLGNAIKGVDLDARMKQLETDAGI